MAVSSAISSSVETFAASAVSSSSSSLESFGASAVSSSSSSLLSLLRSLLQKKSQLLKSSPILRFFYRLFAVFTGSIASFVVIGIAYLKYKQWCLYKEIVWGAQQDAIRCAKIDRGNATSPDRGRNGLRQVLSLLKSIPNFRDKWERVPIVVPVWQ